MKKQRGRPAKREGERKNVDLRIPVTNEQKAMITQAAEIEGVDMATWARPILLEMAKKVLSKMGHTDT
jgi:uncharacterized protein (DUF1778 family)